MTPGQVVPETVGGLLDQMVVLRLQRMKPLPARVDKAALREYAQPEQRAQLAALARRIAAFAEGMRAMEKCGTHILGISRIERCPFRDDCASRHASHCDCLP